ncbi:hypothetical protein BaRGS_00000346, partial [Batillaria attramentaria]
AMPKSRVATRSMSLSGSDPSGQVQSCLPHSWCVGSSAGVGAKKPKKVSHNKPVEVRDSLTSSRRKSGQHHARK